MAGFDGPLMPIVGVCRFSYLGLGDWRAFHSGRRGRTIEEVISAVRKTLFLPKRLEARFATFENLTLPSLAGQTDKDFRFIVLTSEELPEAYATRLKKLASKHPFVELVSAGPGRAVTEFNEAYKRLGYDIGNILQFRLDDDDAVGRNYIRRMRQLGSGFHSIDPGRVFAVTFPNVLMVAQIDGQVIFRHRHYPNTAAGQVIYHPTRNVLDWAHHIVGRKMIVVSEWYDQWVMQSFLTRSNDSGAGSSEWVSARAEEIAPEALARVMRKQFPFAKLDPQWWRPLWEIGDQKAPKRLVSAPAAKS